MYCDTYSCFNLRFVVDFCDIIKFMDGVNIESY